MHHFVTTSCWPRLPLSVLLVTVYLNASVWQHVGGLARADEESIPAGLTVTRVTASPAEIELTRPWQVVQVLLTGHLDSGEQIDVTRMARCTSVNDVVQVAASGRVSPRTDGQQQLVFEVAGQTVQIPVRVAGSSGNDQVSYVRDVSPAMSKMGCNAGTCHGSKDGQRGFKLSLRGYDFEFDHRALTDDIAGRRFNRANPDQSLMLLKASGSIPHVGGALTQPGERHYELLRKWIAAGANLDLDAPRVTKIELFPQTPILPRAELKQQMVVMATYADGTVRDVTADAFIESGNIEVLSAEKSGIVTTLRRGEAPILARFEGAYTATTVTVMGDRSGFVWNDPPTHNYVDELVYDKLQRMKILPSELCTDEEFARRVYLDLTGLPPTADDIRAFLADARPMRQKRDELVDRLIGSQAYVDHWTNKWADLLQVNRKFLGDIGATALRDWVEHAIATNLPYDQFAYEILTASGSTLDHPAAAYWKVLREPAAAMENTTHLFLAVRFNCNKCHDHPFERWTQDQYYHMTAFFAQVGRKSHPQFAGQTIGGSAVESAQPLVEVVYDTTTGETTHERTGVVSPPTFPYGNSPDLPADASRRERLARWIASPDNRYFSSSYVNRLWGYLLGVGLIEPIDDIRAGNPPTNPELLQALSQDFVDSRFDVRHMLRTICKSRVYQHSVRANEWNEDDGINYSHALPRRLPAEVLFDAIHVATGSIPRIPGVPVGLHAAQLPYAGIELPFLDDFGKPPRESACECERTSGIVLGPIMKLINGPTVNDALVDANNELTRLVATQPDDQALVREVFLRFLSRAPTDKELALGVESLSAARGDSTLAAEQLAAHRQKLAQAFDVWEASLPRPVSWQTWHPTQLQSAAGATLSMDADGIVQVSGTLAQDTYTLTGELLGARVTGLRLETLPDASLPQGGPGRADNGNFVVNELKLMAVAARPATENNAAPAPAPTEIPLQNPRASFAQDGWAVSGAIDNNPATGWAIMPQFNRAHEAICETTADVTLPAGSQLQVQVVHQFQDGKHNLGRFRLAFTESDRPLAVPDLPAEIAPLVAVPLEQRSDAQRTQLREYFLQQDRELQRMQAALQVAEQQSLAARLTGIQDLAWALINTPAFLFNR